MQNKKILFKLISAITVIFSFFIYPQTTLANIGVSGAKYSCSTTPGVFEILPHDKTGENYDPDPGINYTALPDDISNLKCHLEHRTLEAQINIIPPQGQGMCMAPGAVIINSIVVDGVTLLERLYFDWACTSEDNPILKLLVRTNGMMVEIETCTENAKLSEKGDEKSKCSTQSFDIDSMKSEGARPSL